jgi:hypothetical protein
MKEVKNVLNDFDKTWIIVAGKKLSEREKTDAVKKLMTLHEGGTFSFVMHKNVIFNINEMIPLSETDYNSLAAKIKCPSAITVWRSACLSPTPQTRLIDNLHRILDLMVDAVVNAEYQAEHEKSDQQIHHNIRYPDISAYLRRFPDERQGQRADQEAAYNNAGMGIAERYRLTLPFAAMSAISVSLFDTAAAMPAFQHGSPAFQKPSDGERGKGYNDPAGT